jgi:hypothetical protein
MISTEAQFTKLVEAVAQQSEHQAALMREYSQPARAALIAHLANVESQRPGPRQVELWAMRKGERRLSCIAVHPANGVDMRLLEGGDIRRTQLVKDGPQAEALAEYWRTKAVARGWA